MVSRQGPTVAADTTFGRLFAAAPTPFLVLAPDPPRFAITEVNDAYLAATMTTREHLIGRALFEAFPDNPDDATATGVGNLRASLDRALEFRKPDTMARQKYDIARPDGSFEQRWWDPVNMPVLDDEGTVVALIHHVTDATGKERAEEALRQAHRLLEGDLADAMVLQTVSTELTYERDVTHLYEQVVDAAVSIMKSDCASLQMLHSERGRAGELHLLAFRGFSPEAAKFWEWVPAGSGSACGQALRTCKRIIVGDIENSDFMAGTPDLAQSRQSDIRAVQATPLVSRHGELVGILSTHWRQPREPSERDLTLFDVLVRQAADLIERKLADTALRESESRFRTMLDNIAPLAWTCDQLGDVTWYNQRWLDYIGLTFEEMKDWGWKQVQHPDHVDRVVAGVEHFRETGEIWEDTFPLRRKDGNYRWFLSRAVPIRDAGGNVVRWFGTNTDVTALRDAEERQKLLINELNHRVKNVLATVQSIAAQTFRAAKLDSNVRENFEARLVALSNAHSILTQESWEGAEIHDILARTLEPHADPERLRMQGPPIRLSPKAALAISMGMHELATNAVKYGALSNGSGRIAVTWTINGSNPATLNLRWAEMGGPAVRIPARKGFGSRLIERNLSHDLDGQAKIDYRPEGVVCTIISRLESVGAKGLGYGAFAKD